jgi:hypothetical protein
MTGRSAGFGTCDALQVFDGVRSRFAGRCEGDFNFLRQKVICFRADQRRPGTDRAGERSDFAIRPAGSIGKPALHREINFVGGTVIYGKRSDGWSG